MRDTLHRLLFAIVAMLPVLCAGIVLNSAGKVWAQITQVYSFEPDLEGFFAVGGGLTLTHEMSGLGATDGANSIKLAFTDFSSFAGARTSNIHPAFNDPLGVDFVRFDLTNTNRLVPPDPVVGEDPTFANTSITFFGDLPGNPVMPAQIQFFFSEEAVGDLEPGAHEIEIDLRNVGGPFDTGGGLNVDTGEIKGYDAWVADGFVPLEFQIYLNKSLAVGDPDFAWTVYIDNIRVGRDVEGTPGDFNEDGRVDAADYVRWRSNDSANDPLPNDNGLASQVERYDLWVANFGEPMQGGGSVSAVPEPTSALLLVIAGVGWYLTKRVRAAL